MDLVIAKRIKELRMGLNGENRHTYRALCLKVTGFEDQHIGQELVVNAGDRLGEEFD